MTEVRALLVDLDGTLADTAAANFEAYSAALAEAGAVVTRSRFDAVAAGLSWRQFLPPLLAEAGVTAEPVEIARRKAEIYAAKIGQIVVNEALVGVLEMCRRGCRTALVTTASASAVSTINARFDLQRLFDTVVTGDDVERHKPDPEAYYLAAARLGVTPQQCIIIEDSDAGIAGAQAFGALVLKVQMI
jgi:HAD superfamily hydrolase (TIGR01509 family)